MRICEPGRLEFGIQLPVQAQSKTFVQPWEAAAGPEAIVSVAKTADRAGYFYVGVCDHPVIAKRRRGWEGTTWFDPIVTLSYLAAETVRINLLTHILVLPLRHPLLVAKAASTLDALSGGRVILGVGAGYALEEFEALGADHENRHALTDDAISVLKASFAQEFPTVTTPSLTLDGELGARPRPERPGGPPIWAGGSSPRALRRAAQLGDGWLPQGESLEQAFAMIEKVRELSDRAGREIPDIGVYADVRVGGDADEAPISGTPEQVAQAFEKHAAAGVGHVLLRFVSHSQADLEEQLELFATEVRPRIGAAG